MMTAKFLLHIFIASRKELNHQKAIGSALNFIKVINTFVLTGAGVLSFTHYIRAVIVTFVQQKVVQKY